MKTYLDNGAIMLDHGEHEMDDSMGHAQSVGDILAEVVPGIHITVSLDSLADFVNGDIGLVLAERNEGACDHMVGQALESEGQDNGTHNEPSQAQCGTDG